MLMLRTNPAPQSGSHQAPPASYHETSRSAQAQSCFLFDVCVGAFAGAVYVLYCSQGLIFPVRRFASAEAFIVALIVFAIARSLPELSYEKLLQAEASLLASVKGECLHSWVTFKTGSGPGELVPPREWTIHSLIHRRHAAASAPAIEKTRPPFQSGAVAVLLHGHSSGSALWEAVLDDVSEAVDRFIVVDLPGWGRSPAPPALLDATNPIEVTELHMEMLQGWFEAMGLNDLGIILIGHSLGGYFAVNFARSSPQSIEQLILIAPAGLTPVMPEGSFVWGTYFKYWPPQRMARALGRLGFVLFTKVYGWCTTENPLFPEYYYRLAFNTISMDGGTGAGDRPAATFLKYNLDGSLWWSTPCLSQLLDYDGHVSVIWGQCDEILPPLLGAMLHRIRPRTDLYYIENGLHNPAHTNARATTAAIVDAISKKRGMPRMTIAGRGLNFEGGDADKLLKMSAIASAVIHDFKDLLENPESYLLCPRLNEKSRCCSTENAGHDTESMQNFGTRRLEELEPLNPIPVKQIMDAASCPGDGIGHEVGLGRGHCNDCFHAVKLHKSYWRCACAAWSFNAHLSLHRTRVHFAAFLAFLDECYVYGNFHARTSKSIVLYLQPRTPLPPRREQQLPRVMQPSHSRLSNASILRELSSAANAVLDAAATVMLAAQTLLVVDYSPGQVNVVVESSESLADSVVDVGININGAREVNCESGIRRERLHDSQLTQRTGCCSLDDKLVTMDSSKADEAELDETSASLNCRSSASDGMCAMGSSHTRISLQPTPALFSRGEVFLLN